MKWKMRVDGGEINPRIFNFPRETKEEKNNIRYEEKKKLKEEDKNKNGSLTFDECFGLTEQLNIQMDKKRLIELFQVKYIRFICLLNKYI